MRIVFCLLLIMGTLHASADEVRVAVASNFHTTLKELAAEFEQQNGHRVVISFGSTGKLYAQIRHGAPFDLFLAADRRRPELLETEGVAVAGSRFTYAVGRLVLWSVDPSLKGEDCRAILIQGGFSRLAIANPKTAPYGLAARQVLEKMALWPQVQDRLVRGENIAQTLQYVTTGNAQLGIVALSQIGPLSELTACRWDIPEDYYRPIEQQAVLLKTGAASIAARAFLAFLRGERAVTIIRGYGYGVE
jgi:molybdate transport system substrate-binding protein